MERFTFRLDRLLSLKKSYERMKREEIGRIKMEMSRIEKEKDRTLGEILKEEEKFRKDGSEVHMMLHRLRYMRGLKDDLDELEMKKKRVEKMLRKKVEEYLEIQRERRTYERLKERKYREYVTENEREMMKFLDDVSMRKHHFEKNKGGNNG